MESQPLTRTDLLEALAATKADLTATIAATRDDLTATIAATREDLTAALAATREDLTAAIAASKDEILATTRFELAAAKDEILATTRFELAAAKDEILTATRAELAHGLAATEAKLVETVRDAQTEVLKAFFSYSTGQQVKFQHLEADSTNTVVAMRKRMDILEQRLLEIEKRLFQEPPAA